MLIYRRNVCQYYERVVRRKSERGVTKKKRLVRSSMDRIALLEIPLSMSTNSSLIINRLLERLTRVHIIISALNCCASKFLCKYYLSAYLLSERAAGADIVMSVQESINKQRSGMRLAKITRN